MTRYAWWQAAAMGLALLVICLPLATRLVVGQRGAIVHVRWQPSVDEATRAVLEARFRLVDGQQLDDSTWRYDLLDPSADNIRALVDEPDAADTHHIGRSDGSVDRSATRTSRRLRFASGGDTAVTIVDRVAIVLALAAVLLFALGMSAQTSRRSFAETLRSALRASATTLAPAARWLSRGIPSIDAKVAALFRIVFGAIVVAFFAMHRVDTWWLGSAFVTPVRDPVQDAVVRWLSPNPGTLDLLMPWLLITAVAFTVGIFTRYTYALFVAGAILWAYVAVLRDSTHPHSTLILAIVALLPSRWGDAWSVDAWLRRRAGRSDVRPAGKQYGYSVWVPCLVFGIAFAAAAWAKLAHGSAWILNGSVKYHFITDSLNAPVDWGLQLAGYPLLAIVASMVAVATEALMITAAFSRSEWYRVVLGMVALALLAGFFLFMGVLWPGWWILLLGFLPWQSLSRVLAQTQPASVAPQFARRSTAAQLTAIGLLIAQQLVVSTLAIERAPMFTHYPMYSNTHASAAAFDASIVPFYRIVISTPRGPIELSCNASDDLVEEFRAALHGSEEAAATAWRRARACGTDISDADSMTLEGDSRVFDWQRLKITSTPAAEILGPLPVDASLPGAGARTPAGS
jgi:hypothetical protein